MAAEPLPAPRAVLTSLINALAAQPSSSSTSTSAQVVGGRPNPSGAGLAEELGRRSSGTAAAAPSQTQRHVGQQQQQQQQQQQHNPLARLPAPARSILTTLHVLYPGLLLPALDLLDRGLVTRVLVAPKETKGGEQGGGGHPRPPTARDGTGEEHGHDGSHDGYEQMETGEEQERETGAGPHAGGGEHASRAAATFHLVRSAQPSRRGRRPGGGGDGHRGPTYVVRTGAWSCDCAAFAFAAFPAAPSSGGTATAASLPFGRSRRRVKDSEDEDEDDDQDDVGGIGGGDDDDDDDDGATSVTAATAASRGFYIGPISGMGTTITTTTTTTTTTGVKGSPRHDDHEHDHEGISSGQEQQHQQQQQQQRAWEFGGLSLDGLGDKMEGSGSSAASGMGSGPPGPSSSPPCCKHLLACVLAERWVDGLGDYVQERRVSREEAAGLVGAL